MHTSQYMNLNMVLQMNANYMVTPRDVKLVEFETCGSPLFVEYYNADQVLDFVGRCQRTVHVLKEFIYSNCKDDCILSLISDINECSQTYFQYLVFDIGGRGWFDAKSIDRYLDCMKQTIAAYATAALSVFSIMRKK